MVCIQPESGMKLYEQRVSALEGLVSVEKRISQSKIDDSQAELKDLEITKLREEAETAFKIADLRGDLDTERQMKSLLELKLMGAQEELRYEQNVRAALASQLEGLKESSKAETAHASAQIRSLQLEIRTLESTAGTLRGRLSEFEKLQTELDALRIENETLTRRVSDLNDELSKNRAAESTKQQKEKADHQKESEEIIRREKALKEKIQTQSLSIEKREKSVAKAEKELQLRIKDVDTKDKLLEKREKALDTKERSFEKKEKMAKEKAAKQKSENSVGLEPATRRTGQKSTLPKPLSPHVEENEEGDGISLSIEKQVTSTAADSGIRKKRKEKKNMSSTEKSDLNVPTEKNMNGEEAAVPGVAEKGRRKRKDAAGFEHLSADVTEEESQRKAKKRRSRKQPDSPSGSTSTSKSDESEPSEESNSNSNSPGDKENTNSADKSDSTNPKNDRARKRKLATKKSSLPKPFDNPFGSTDVRRPFTPKDTNSAFTTPVDKIQRSVFGASSNPWREFLSGGGFASAFKG
eukprot:Rmarinus@m.29025